MSTSTIKQEQPLLSQSDLFLHSLQTRSTSGTVSFTFSQRGAALLLIHRNGFGSSVYAVCLNSDETTMVAEKLCGGTLSSITNSGKTVSISLPNWSGVTILSNVQIS